MANKFQQNLPKKEGIITWDQNKSNKFHSGLISLEQNVGTVLSPVKTRLFTVEKES